MQNDTTDKLNIIMDHIPCNLVSASHPMVLPYGIVTFDCDEFLCGAEVTVKLGSLNSDYFILLETAGRRLHYRECVRKNLIKSLFNLLVNLLHKFVRLCSQSLLL